MKKSAFIAGGTGGLGLALTRRLASEGWQVFAADCDQKSLAELDGQANIQPLYVDVTSTESVDAAYIEVNRRVDRLAAVVNFAGILRVGAMVEVDEEVLRQLLDVNLMGTYRVNKAFFPLLGRGRIVNISSETGWHTASPFNGPYAMSKYAIEAYSDALRRELSIYDIPVVLVQPGPFKTPLVSGTVDGFYQAAQGSALYREQLKHFGQLVCDANHKAANPEVLAAVIHRALTVRKPKARYSVKADPGRSLLEYLPTSVSDWVYRKILSKRASVDCPNL